MRPDEFRRATEVTYLGAVYGTMAALKRMVPRDRGTIVQVGSALAYRAIPLQSAYCGAKFAMRGFTDSVRTELMHDKSRTSGSRWCICRRSTRRSSTGAVRGCPTTHSRCLRSTSRRCRPKPSTGPRTTAGARSTSASAPSPAIVGNKLAPRMADWYLARTGYQSQQVADMPVNGRRDNLYEPVPDEAATRGIFDDRARDRSWQLWSNTHRPLIAGAVALAAATARRARAGRR